jgi:hypothetical protein
MHPGKKAPWCIWRDVMRENENDEEFQECLDKCYDELE